MWQEHSCGPVNGVLDRDSGPLTGRGDWGRNPQFAPIAKLLFISYSWLPFLGEYYHTTGTQKVFFKIINNIRTVFQIHCELLHYMTTTFKFKFIRRDHALSEQLIAFTCIETAAACRHNVAALSLGVGARSIHPLTNQTLLVAVWKHLIAG